MEEASESKVSWICNKGLAVGKGILATGVVISSAPLILPPLLVFSAIGFACAVPCGLYLASYACTEKLMSKLLPGTRPPRFLLDYEEGDYDGGGIEKGDGVVGNLDLEEDTEHGVKRGFEVVDEGNEEDRVANGHAYHYEQHKEEELEANASENSEVDNDKEDIDEYVGYEKEKPTEVPIEGSAEEENEVPVVMTTESTGYANEVQGHMIATEGEEVAGTGVNEDAPSEVTSVTLELCEGQDSAANEELNGETNKLNQDIRDDGEVDKIEDNKGINDGAKEDAAENIKQDQETGKEKEATSAENEVPEESEHSSSSEHSPTSDKMVHSEEKIRNQLSAIRTIVGYTASPGASCVEELKALYIFIGVEPPESLQDPANLVEVDDKLKCLMAIVGVK